MTPSFIGLIATMLPGVRPSISFASLPTASTRPLILLMATIDGSLTTMPFPRAYTHVLAVPRSMARSLENSEKNEPRGTGVFPFELVGLGSLRKLGQLGDLNAVLADRFDFVHRPVGGPQQLFGRRRDVGQRGDAD